MIQGGYLQDAAALMQRRRRRFGNVAPFAQAAGPGPLGQSVMIGRGTVPPVLVPSKLPVTTGLIFHFRAREPTIYEPRGLPANGASVGTARLLDSIELPIARRGVVGQRYGSNALPTYAANADGGGRGALRFTAASQQLLAITPAALGTRTVSDTEISFFAVVRLAAAPTTRRFVTVSRASEGFTTRSVLAFGITATAFQFFANQNFGADPGTVTLTLTPATGQTYLLFGRHGNVTNGRISTLRVRAGGANNDASGTFGPTLAWQASGSWLDEAVIGGAVHGNTPQLFSDDFIFEFAAWPRFLSDAERDSVMTYGQTQYGVP